MPHQILIADRDPLVREELEGFLHGKLGYGVVCAAGGQDAVQKRSNTTSTFISWASTGPTRPRSPRLHKLNPDLQAIFLTTKASRRRSGISCAFPSRPNAC